MDRLLKRIHRVRPAAFCSREFFLVARQSSRPQCCKCLPVFDPPKMLQPFLRPCPPDLSPPDHFLFPKLKMKLKGLHFADVAEIQEAVTDQLKKVEKRGIFGSFQKLYDRAKACIYANGAFCEYKNDCVASSCVFDFLKKSVLNYSISLCVSF
jgi:hypothetical protein